MGDGTGPPHSLNLKRPLSDASFGPLRMVPLVGTQERPTIETTLRREGRLRAGPPGWDGTAGMTD